MRIILSLVCLGVAVSGASAAPEKLTEVRSTVERWLSVENAISREEIDWEEEKVVLLDLIAVAEARIAKLETELVEAREVRSAADEKRADLLERRDAIAAQANRIEQFLTESETALLELAARLPDPLREELAPLYQRIPRSSTTAGLGERMQTVVGILTQIGQFNGRITVSETVRTLPGQQGKGSFRTLWLGLGQAYYLAPDDAGFGTVDDEGWKWHSRPGLADAVREAIALSEGTAGEPKLVGLPVQVKEGPAQ